MHQRSEQRAGSFWVGNSEVVSATVREGDWALAGKGGIMLPVVGGAEAVADCFEVTREPRAALHAAGPWWLCCELRPAPAPTPTCPRHAHAQATSLFPARAACWSRC